MGREKALAIVCICVAIVVVLKNAHVLHTRGYLTGSGKQREVAPRLDPTPRLPEVRGG